MDQFTNIVATVAVSVLFLGSVRTSGNNPKAPVFCVLADLCMTAFAIFVIWK